MALTQSGIKTRLQEIAASETAPENVKELVEGVLLTDRVIGYPLATVAAKVEAVLDTQDDLIDVESMSEAIKLIKIYWDKITP